MIAGTHAEIYNEQHSHAPTWTGAGTGTAPSTPRYAEPFLSALALLDGPRNITRNSLSVKADWRVTPTPCSPSATSPAAPIRASARSR